MAVTSSRHVEDEAHRLAEFDAWLDDNLPAEWCQRVFPPTAPPGDEDPEGVALSRQWQKMLDDGGWAAPGWPVEYAGRGLGIAGRLGVAQRLARARAPVPIGFQGVEMLGPTLIEHGTPEQRERFLPGIRSGETIWCQGYSEPDAGSDLAGLATTAERDGDHYVLNGQKVWTSFGQRADWCFILARTGPATDRHRSISFLVAAMDTPGIEWRPISDISGAEDFGELFLDDAGVPADQLVGGEGNGWRVAMSSLSHERILASNSAHVRARVDALIDLTRRASPAPAIRDAVLRLVSRTTVLEKTEARVLLLAERADPFFPAAASLLKVAGTELRQEIAESAASILGQVVSATASDSAGLDAKNEASVWANELLESRAATIYAGSSEIQRNIMAERGLGLPKD